MFKEMWPFTRKRRLNTAGSYAGSTADSFERFGLTSEEQQEVSDALAMFFPERDGSWYVREDSADAIIKAVTAWTLSERSKKFALAALRMRDLAQKQELIDLAVSAAQKACDIDALPIYWYDLASFIEMSRDRDVAKPAFQHFVDFEGSFQPTEIQQIFVRQIAEERDVDEAMIDARSKLK